MKKGIIISLMLVIVGCTTSSDNLRFPDNPGKVYGVLGNERALIAGHFGCSIGDVEIKMYKRNAFSQGYFEASCPAKGISWTQCHIDAAYIRCKHNGAWDKGWVFNP